MELTEATWRFPDIESRRTSKNQHWSLGCWSDQESTAALQTIKC